MTNEERDKLFEFVNFMTKYILEVQKEQDEKYASNDRNRMYRRGYIKGTKNFYGDAKAKLLKLFNVSENEIPKKD